MIFAFFHTCNTRRYCIICNGFLLSPAQVFKTPQIKLISFIMISIYIYVRAHMCILYIYTYVCVHRCTEVPCIKLYKYIEESNMVKYVKTLLWMLGVQCLAVAHQWN